MHTKTKATFILPCLDAQFQFFTYTIFIDPLLTSTFESDSNLLPAFTFGEHCNSSSFNSSLLFHYFHRWYKTPSRHILN